MLLAHPIILLLLSLAASEAKSCVFFGPNEPRVPWVMALSGGSGEMIAAAILSARDHFPQLQPHVLLMNRDCATESLGEWLREQGAIVHENYVLSFDAQMRKHGHYVCRGAWGRLDVPVLFPNETLVLYTDSDVLWLNHPADGEQYCLASNVSASVGPEAFPNQIANTGVMWMSPSVWIQDQDIVDNCIKGGPEGLLGCGQDQRRILNCLKPIHRLSRLENEWNWKAYWTPASHTKVYAVHFHGPKPHKCLESFVAEEPLKCPHRAYRGLMKGTRKLRSAVGEWDFANKILKAFSEYYNEATRCSNPSIKYSATETRWAIGAIVPCDSKTTVSIIPDFSSGLEVAHYMFLVGLLVGIVAFPAVKALYACFLAKS